MSKILRHLKNFFFPPVGTSKWLRVLPYALLGLLTMIVLASSAYAWDYTNSPEFCGTACHTMPPEFTSYLTSPHARVDCVDCHIGKGFITTRITRKAGDAKHIIRLAFKDYEFPITANDLRPARETCEKCHFPEKFSDDSLRKINHFGDDPENTPTSIYLIMKTGGGTRRLGLGYGIHWHIENQVLFYATDAKQQEIPYIRVINNDGSVDEYVDIESELDVSLINEDQLTQMDCITCHNRITHLVNHPEDIVDQMLDNKIISPSIPDIRRQAVELFYRTYPNSETGMNAIFGLKQYYETYYSDYFSENESIIEQAIYELQKAYSASVHVEQKSDWNSHPNNIGHKYSPGCFRCHDGQHLNDQDNAIRLECNLCHSIPVVAQKGDFVTDIEISRGPEPSTHLNPNWISLHRDFFDDTCKNCHTTEDPGGVSNTSFCSNSACHGVGWDFAGFNAPALREILASQMPLPVLEPEITEDSPLNYESTIGNILNMRCGSCHGVDGLQGFNLTTYESLMEGGISGAVIIPGDPDNSLMIQNQSGVLPHFAQLTPEELKLMVDWILVGAPK